MHLRPRVDVSEGTVERLVPEGLPDQEGVGSLIHQQHGGRMLQDVRMLQGFAQAGFPCDLGGASTSGNDSFVMLPCNGKKNSPRRD